MWVLFLCINRADTWWACVCAVFANTTALGCSWQKPSLLVQLRGCFASANAPQPCTGSQNGMGCARWIWGATVLNKICLPGVRCPWLWSDHPCSVLLLPSHPLLGYCVVVISAEENLISAGKGKSENNGKAFGIWHFSVEDGNKYIYNFTAKKQDFFPVVIETLLKLGKPSKIIESKLWHIILKPPVALIYRSSLQEERMVWMVLI